jgi:hypothetical protein
MRRDSKADVARPATEVEHLGIRRRRNLGGKRRQIGTTRMRRARQICSGRRAEGIGDLIVLFHRSPPEKSVTQAREQRQLGWATLVIRRGHLPSTESA